MEIKKGDRFRCIKSCKDLYTKGKVYESEIDGSITNNKGHERHIWAGGTAFTDYFQKITAGLPDSYFIQSDSPTSPSHYKAYDIESIEMMIRIWGKQRVAEWCEITAFKYRTRMGMKDNFETDLKKEAYYLAKWKELRDDVAG